MSKSSEAILISGLKDVEERISGFEDKIKEIDSSLKETFKLQKKPRSKTSRKSGTLWKCQPVNNRDREINPGQRHR